MTTLTLDQINDQTGFANGDKFESDQQVREYFTPDAQREMFGDDAVTDPETLEEMADAVIENRWHMEEPADDTDEIGTAAELAVSDAADDLQRCGMRLIAAAALHSPPIVLRDLAATISRRVETYTALHERATTAATLSVTD